MKQTKKRTGFTVVELVIVIAVVAVLAAVMIPVFSGIIDTANLSNDTSLVANINKILAAEKILLNRGANDAVEVRKFVKENGLKLETKTKGQYLWYDVANNQVVLAGITEDGDIALASAGARDATGKGKLKEATSPENFVEGYLFISEGSSDGLANAIYTLRNPASAENITNALKEIAKQNGPLYDTLNAFMSTTAVMTENATFFAGENAAVVNRIVVSDKMSTVKPGALTALSDFPSVIVVDFHSGVIGIDANALTAITTTHSKIFFVYNNAEIEAIDKKDGGNIANLIPIGERSKYVKQVYIQLVVDGAEVGDATPHGNEFAAGNYTFPCNFTYKIKTGDATTSYDFVGYSLYANGASPIAIGAPSYTLTDAEKFLIEGGSVDDPDGGNLTVYLVYKTATTAFMVDGKYYSSQAMTYLLSLDKDAAGAIKSGTITVLSTDAKLDADLIADFGIENPGELTIQSGVTLHLPYQKADGSLSADTSAKDGDDIINDSSINYDTTFNKLKENLGQTKLTIADGVTLTNNGTIFVDAQLYGYSGEPEQCFINEVCGVLVIDGTLKSKGSIYSYGVTRGNGELVAEKDSTVTEIFTVLDWHGGTNASACIDNKVSPFHDWKVDNIRVKMTIHAGVKYSAFGSVYVSGNNAIDFVLVSSSTTDKPLFVMETGAIVQKTYDDGYNLAILAGTVKDNPKEVSVSLATAKFSEIALPMPNFDLTVKTPTTGLAATKLELNNNLYKILPGSEIKVEKGAELVVNTTVAVYDDYNLNLIPTHKVGSAFETEILVELKKEKDVLTECTYTDTTLTAKYDHYEATGMTILGVPIFGSYEKIADKSGKKISNCSVRAYSDWDELDASLVINGKLTFGSKAVFTGNLESSAPGAEIVVTAGATFQNSKQVTDVNGNPLTVHNFGEGVAFTAATEMEVSLFGKTMKMAIARWQPARAVGVATTGTFRLGDGITSVVQTIPAAATTYTYNGSAWMPPSQSGGGSAS